MSSTGNQISQGGRRRFCFGMMAVLFGLAIVAIAEIALRFAGVAETTDAEDRFMTPAAAAPLFVLDEATGRYNVRPERFTFFRPDSFPAKKGPGTFRIFCIGGSTVQGRPYSIETAFPAWLELALCAADSAREWDVVNCGGISYASFRLLPIVREVLTYAPDLIIICIGHNEFLEERSYHPAAIRTSRLSPLLTAAGRLRLYRLGRAVWRKLEGQREAEVRTPADPGPTVRAVLDSPEGMSTYHRDDGHARAVVAHFRETLLGMIQSARKQHVPVLIVSPPANIKDCSPFKSEHTAAMSPDEIREAEALCDAANGAFTSDEALRALARTAELDPRHAGVLFRLGRSYLDTGRADLAAKALEQARDEDVCPLRITGALRKAIAETADSTDTPLVDAHALLAEHSESGIPGDEFLVDHVHPTVAGHQVIARTLLEAMSAMDLVTPEPDWRDTCDTSFAAHIKGLPDAYFHQGMLRLQRVQRWARGRWEEHAPD